jgi:hypothetical protein
MESEEFMALCACEVPELGELRSAVSKKTGKPYTYQICQTCDGMRFPDSKKKGKSAPAQPTFVSPQEMAKKFPAENAEIFPPKPTFDSKSLMMAESYVKDLYIAALNFANGELAAMDQILDHALLRVKTGAKFLLGE